MQGLCDLLKAAGPQGSSCGPAPQLERRFTRSNASEDKNNQTTFPTTKGWIIFSGLTQACGLGS